MTESQQNLYECIPAPLQPLTRYKELVPHVGEAFANALMEIIPIYNTSEFLAEMHQLPYKHNEFKQVSLGRLFYQDEYLVGYLDKSKAKSAYASYYAGYELKSPLMAYEFLVFANRHGNSFSIIHHHGIGQYDALWLRHTLATDVRGALYENICTLAQQSLWIDTDALAYSPQTQDFKVLDFQKVSLKQQADPVMKDAYLSRYRQLLKL